MDDKLRLRQLAQLKRLDRRIHAAVVYAIQRAPDLADIATTYGLKAYLYKCNHRDEIATAALHRLKESMRPKSIGEDIMAMLGQEPPPEIKRVPKPSPEEIDRGYAFALGNQQSKPRIGSMPTAWQIRQET